MSGLGFALDLSHGPWATAPDHRAAVARTLEIGRIADEAGIESVWVSEDPDGWDAFAVLGALATVTERVRLGSGVVNPYQRHPNLIAASLATLDQLSGGRAFLGLGRGQTEWYERALGIQTGHPLRALEETFSLLRQWELPPHRAHADHPAAHFDVRGWERTIPPVQPHPPIYLAAVGPKALALAGRLADGVVFNDLASVEFMRQAINDVRQTASAAGRDTGRLAFYARTGVTITDDPEPVLERRKATVALIHTLPGMDRLLDTPGFDIPAIIGEVRRLMKTEEVLAAGGGFPDLRRAGDLAAARRAIPTDLMARLAIVGPLPHVRARLRQFASIGVTHVFLASPAPNETGDEVAARVRALAAV